MSDFDDQARAASERLRRRATALAAGVDREARLADTATSSPNDRSTARWLIATGAVAAVAVGVVGVLAMDREPSIVTTDDERSPTSVVVPTPTTPTTPMTALAQAVPLTEPPDATVTAPPTVDLTRPVADPSVCESFTAIDGALAGLPLNPGNLPLTLFARPSSAPIPIQIIGNPVDGPTKPFAVIQRSFEQRPNRPARRPSTSTELPSGSQPTPTATVRPSGTWLTAARATYVREDWTDTMS